MAKSSKPAKTKTATKATQPRTSAPAASAQPKTTTDAQPPVPPGKSGKEPKQDKKARKVAKAGKEPTKGKDKDQKDKGHKDGDAKAGGKKLVRDSFTMPAGDYSLIAMLKTRSLAGGVAVKKSELLRAGLISLSVMPPARLFDVLEGLPKIKTGRPGKKK